MSTFTVSTTFQQANTLVSARSTTTLYGSALVTMSPVSAISSVQISQIALRTPDTRFGTVSANRTLPYTAVNNSSIIFNVIYDNSALTSMADTTVGKLVSAVATTINPALCAVSSNTIAGAVSGTAIWASTPACSISATNWWLNFASRAEHARLYVNGDI